MAKTVLRLAPSEGIVVHAASRIYAAFLTMGKVAEGEEDRWMKEAIEQATRLAKATDEYIQSDDELG